MQGRSKKRESGGFLIKMKKPPPSMDLRARAADLRANSFASSVPGLPNPSGFASDPRRFAFAHLSGLLDLVNAQHRRAQ